MQLIRELRAHMERERLKTRWDDAMAFDEASVSLAYLRDRVLHRRPARWAIVVPYRDRAPQLALFLAHMQEYLPRNGFGDGEVWVVEQAAGRPFNRGLVRNIGFLEAAGACGAGVVARASAGAASAGAGGAAGVAGTGSEEGVDYVCFHDVDCLPAVDGLDYSSPKEGIRHLYGHDHCLGGVMVATTKSFSASNGFPNNFFGWGREDAVLELRYQLSGGTIDRTQTAPRWGGAFLELPCDPDAGSSKDEFFRMFKARVASGEYAESVRLFDELKLAEVEAMRAAVLGDDAAGGGGGKGEGKGCAGGVAGAAGAAGGAGGGGVDEEGPVRSNGLNDCKYTVVRRDERFLPRTDSLDKGMRLIHIVVEVV